MKRMMCVTCIALLLLYIFPSCNTNGGIDFLVIDTFSPTGPGTSDIALSLVDGSGLVLATDKNGNPSHNGYARILYSSPLPAGTYYVRVTKDSGTGSQFYGIRLLEYDPGTSFPTPGADPDAADSDDGESGGIPTNPVSIALEEVQSRAIDPEDTDVDWFEFIIP